MSNQHRDPAVTVRVPRQVKEAAQTQLDQRGLAKKAFVVACMAALAKQPDNLLKLLEPHWPTPSPRGRPYKQRHDGEST